MFFPLGAAGLLVLASLESVLSQDLSSCPGYTASDVVQTDSGLTASLTLAGDGCNVYGYDLPDLTLLVQYQTDSRLHIKIFDQSETAYQVPESVVGRPGNDTVSAGSSLLSFNLTQDPFSFAVQRTDSGETIFDTSGTALVFESQYLRLRTFLPADPNIYGFGEDTDPFRRPTTDYTRTLWSRDAYLIPPGTNLYGNHPIYFEHRASSSKTHGVFMLNSDGMDLYINSDAAGQYLEYNIIGGVIDLYVLAGPGPVDVARQYSDVIGQPTMMPYWSFGFHQCRYGMQDVYEVAAVVANYSVAEIPLETMWTDIDYMDMRKVFTLDPERFPLEKMQELVTYLHDHDQHYIVMVDPAVAYQNYSAFENGESAGIFMKNSDGSIFQGVVWPGIAAFPDWFNSATQGYWNSEFSTFFSPTDGVDIDGLWIDMNEASNFCPYPCSDPAGFAVFNSDPPPVPAVRPNAGYPIPGFPADFQPSSSSRIRRGRFLEKRQIGTAGAMMGLPNRDLLDPPYSIHNKAGSLSNLTINTDLIHANGLAEYDTHNLYGTMMSETSRGAMLNRRAGLRPLVITRSTFAGAGRYVGHWLGDNNSDWPHYRISIAEMIAFAAIYQIPMVGSDVCGYAGNTTEELCARWAMLGAFYPFYRNHDATDVLHQEYYLWASVTEAAKVAIKARYQLLDYIYTALYQQSVDGTPILNPMFFLYPSDTNTLPLDLQYFYGPSILVAPVTDEGATSVSVYFPNDQFYDFFTYEPLRGTGSSVTIDANLTQIPVYIKGGAVIPIRSDVANTTAALRELNFNLVVAPGVDGKASGSLYLDDGVSISPAETSVIGFAYDGTTLSMSGSFGYDAGDVSITDVILLSPTGSAKTVTANKPLTGGFSMSLS